VFFLLKLGRLSARNERIDTATTERDTIPYTYKTKENILITRIVDHTLKYIKPYTCIKGRTPGIYQN
jgi:hypothetical protein